MKIEDQVVSLKLAKKLKELGVKQESLFVYYDLFNDEESVHFKIGTWNKCIPLEHTDATKHCLSAFIGAELGEMLPIKVLKSGRWLYTINCGKWDRNGKEEWYCCYDTDKGQSYFQETASTEADARAKMLIYSLENQLLTLPTT